MNTSSLLQSFAMDKSGRIRSVEEVTRGLACDCVCPSCGETVIARQGEVREWHFAHSSGADCPGSGESALHLAAKQVLLDAGGMTIPAQSVNKEVVLPDGLRGEGESTRRDAWLDLPDIEAEKKIGSFRPDIAAMVGHTLLVVEVAVTHFVDEDKRQMIVDHRIPAIEIDLATVERREWTWKALKEAVIDGVTHKQWLYQIDQLELQQEAHEKALQDALTSSLVEKADSQKPKPRRTRFYIDGRIVDVIDRPYCAAVWSPYDPVLIEMIKPRMKEWGGRWDRKIKNWIFPIEAGQYLKDELEKMSGQPPEIFKT